MRSVHVDFPTQTLLAYEAMAEGAGVTGLTVTARVYNPDSGQYLDGAGAEGASPTDISCTEVDDVEMPGCYLLDLAAAFSDQDNGPYIVAFAVDSVTVEHCHLSVGNRMDVPHPNGAPIRPRDVLNSIAVLNLVFEGTASDFIYMCSDTDGTGAKFYTPHTIDAGRYADFAGRAGVLYDFATGPRAVIVVSVHPTYGTAPYMVLTYRDGSTITAGFTSGMAGLFLHQERSQTEIANEVLITEVGGLALTAPGSLAETVMLTLGLRQNNMRILYTAWTAQGSPSEGVVLVYASQADAESDTDPWPLTIARFPFTTGYDVDGKLESYLSVRNDAAVP